MRLRKGRYEMNPTAMRSRLDDEMPFTRDGLILMADDDMDYHLIARCALLEVGFRGMFQGVSNGVELMDYLYRRSRSNPDLIILDLNMPELDGRSCLQEIKGKNSLCHIPVAVLTTSTRKEDIEFCKRFRKCTYSVKPASFSEWVCLLGGMLREHLPLAQDPPMLDEIVDFIPALNDVR